MDFAEIALEVADRTNSWVFDHRKDFERFDVAGWLNSGYLRGDSKAENGSADDAYWSTLEPLTSRLLAQPKMAWISLVFRFVSERAFRAHMVAQPDVKAADDGTRWALNLSIPRLYEAGAYRQDPFEMLISADLCFRVTDDNIPILVSRIEEPAPKLSETSVRIISCRRFADAACGAYDTLTDLWLKVAEPLRNEPDVFADPKVREVMNAINEILESALQGCKGPPFEEIHTGTGSRSEELDREMQRGRTKWLAMAKYITMMHAVCPDWSRIIMLPHRGPVATRAQPGGLVLCERGAAALLGHDELKNIATIVSTAMWPWQTIGSRELGRKEGAVGDVAYLARVIEHEYNNLYALSMTELNELRRSGISAETLDRLSGILGFTSYSYSGLRGVKQYTDQQTELAYIDKILENLISEMNKWRAVDVSWLRKEKQRVKAPIVFYLILAELLRNAGKHCKGPKDQPARITVVTWIDGDQGLRIRIQNRALPGEATRLQRKIDAASANPEVVFSAGKTGLDLCVELIAQFQGTITASAMKEQGEDAIAVEIALPQGQK
jgi:hypothetical protein